jgi:predicted enzyme related to lactoylglutathione lyase
MVFFQVTIDANDPERLARFWALALGWQAAPPLEPASTWADHYRRRLDGAGGFPNRVFDPEGLRPPLFFQQVPEPKAGKNRIHLDLYPTGRDGSVPHERRIAIVEAKVAELLAAGGSVERRTRNDEPDDLQYWVVMHDPEGNELCVS